MVDFSTRPRRQPGGSWCVGVDGWTKAGSMLCLFAPPRKKNGADDGAELS